MGSWAGVADTLAIPVSLLASSAYMHIYQLCDRRGSYAGLGPSLPTTRFTVGGCSDHRSYVTILAGEAHIQGVKLTSGHHPFHCRVLKVATMLDTLLTRNVRNCEKGQKTLG